MNIATKKQLSKLIEFTGSTITEQWVSAKAKLIKPSTTSWLHLSQPKQVSLNKACMPGMEIIPKLYSHRVE